MADDVKAVSLEVRQFNGEYLPPKQSANTLFHFFSKQDYLFDALKKNAIVPRYYCEDIGYLDIAYRRVAYPMICFCDITVHRLEEHLGLYGKYGIAFSKSWGINRGIQPLQYVNNHSALKHDFSDAFMAALSSKEESPTADFLLTQMQYMKPIEGTMPRNKKDIEKNFTDECEWRFIPNVASIELPQVLTEDEIASSEVLNNTILDNKCCWLEFELSEVKYIIIQTESDFQNLCQIIKEISPNEKMRLKLTSKIIIWENAKEDF